MEDYTDGMRQTIVADLLQLKVADSVLLASAKEGDLDTTLIRLIELQPPVAETISSAAGVADDDVVSDVADDVTDDVVDLDVPDLRLARDTAYMIPQIAAWQKQLGRKIEE